MAEGQGEAGQGARHYIHIWSMCYLDMRRGTSNLPQAKVGPAKVKAGTGSWSIPSLFFWGTGKDRKSSSEDGDPHYGLAQWVCVFSVPLEGPVPAMSPAAWAPVTPAVGIVPAKSM